MIITRNYTIYLQEEDYDEQMQCKIKKRIQSKDNVEDKSQKKNCK